MMKPNTEPCVQSYVRLIRAAEGLHTQVSRGLGADGLSASQFSAMKVLKIHGRLAQRDIARYILKSGGNITFIVDNLESMGLVSRIRDTVDRRVIYVQLTDAGNDLFDQVYPSHLQRIRDAMGTISEAECCQLMDILQKLSPEVDDVPCAPAEPVAARR